MNKTSMNFKILLIILTLAVANSIYAQTGIGTTTPNASAKLDVYATDKGFLPPRVALTATNSASPITSPANGLMVFNTVTAGSSPNQVVPGYYYWDATGLKWVSLSTTVGNVQNQAIFRSTASNTNGTAVSTWNARFNNIASGDLTVSLNTTFALSNGIYKIQWGLPHQSTQTYNIMQLQENISGTWTAWRNDANLANLANGGNTDWGGTSFMTDVVDCSSSTKTLRLINADGSRALLLGASFIITKLNSDITTSTTADNLGNHTATKNILLNGNYLSNDGGNEGIRIDNSGNVGLGTTAPSTNLHIENGNILGTNPASTTSPSLYISNSNNASSSAHSTALIRTAGLTSGKPYLGFDVASQFGYSIGINNPTDQLIFNTTWNFATGTAANNAITINKSGQSRVVVPSQDGSLAPSWPSGWGGGIITYDFSCAGIYYTSMTARSDRRLKNTIVDLDNDFVSNYLQLRPVNFYWNDGSDNKHRQYGLIAQEVEALFPDIVSIANDSMQTKSVNYQALHALSLKVIQAQQAEIELLKKNQAGFEARLLKLEAKLNQ
jgi:hypothetical protein